MFEAFVYILRCSDGSYYVGSARRDLDRRISQHQGGEFGGYTSTRRPVVVVWSDYYQRITDDIEMERRIKGWSRAKKEALINGAGAEVARPVQAPCVLRDGSSAASSG